jgi:anti-anti-sigma factor
MDGPPLTFQIRESTAAGSLRLSLVGELDLASVPELEDRLALLRATNCPTRLDLSELDFIDSTGLHVLVRAVGDARRTSWSFQIEPEVGPQVMRMFKLVEFDRFVMAA